METKGQENQWSPNQRKLTLRELLAKVTPENTHEETDWGKRVGKEVVE